ncbi:MAG: hypothetical protein LAP87_16840 [Acidobacteriia bacterium]|nr:hypothetical protein [Terriglobia bacterium]
MSEAAVLPISVALVFREPSQAQRLGRVLQAAIGEIETLYNLGQQRILLTRHLISDVPIRGPGESDWLLVRFMKRTWSSFTGEATEPPGIMWNAVPLGDQKLKFWEASQGKFVDTVNPEKLLEFVRSTAGVSDQQALLVVVDQRITPPEGFVYIIGKSYGPRDDQAIISTVPMDPEYWDIKEANPLALIKQRFRATCAAFIGERLGLKQCPEPACYMYRLAGDPEVLDGMVRLGAEHRELPELAEKGFSVPSGDPAAVQPVEVNPQPKGWQALA